MTQEYYLRVKRQPSRISKRGVWVTVNTKAVDHFSELYEVGGHPNG